MSVINKRGDKLLSFWWMFIIVIIAIGLVAGVLLFYGSDVDVRSLEAGILADKVTSCIDHDGYLSDSFSSMNFDVFKECNISRNVFETNSDFYLKIEVRRQNGSLIWPAIVEGNAPFEKDCQIAQSVIAKKYPRCYTESENMIYYHSGNSEIVKVNVVAGSNQGIKKVGASV